MEDIFCSGYYFYDENKNEIQLIAQSFQLYLPPIYSPKKSMIMFSAISKLFNYLTNKVINSKKRHQTSAKYIRNFII